MSEFAGKRVRLDADSDLGLALAVALSRAGARIVVPDEATASAVWDAGGTVEHFREDADWVIAHDKEAVTFRALP